MSDSVEKLYLRKCSLVIGGNGDGIELNEFKIVFKTQHADFETPNRADIRIFNLSDQTANKIQKEFTKVVLQAGYEGNFGLIFGGNVRQVRRGRIDGKDTYLDILASDGDRAYNYSVVNKTLAAGSTLRDQVNAAKEPMEPLGVSTGYIPDLGGDNLPRGKVMYGMSRKYIKDASEASQTTWSIQNGYMQMVPVQNYLPGEAIVLTSETGLIGRPEQTNEGIKIKALLNPSFRVGGRVKLDNKSVNAFKTSLSVGFFNKVPRLDDDGLYRILAIDFSGDTRGQEWYADLICVGIDASAPIGSRIIDTNGGR